MAGVILPSTSYYLGGDTTAGGISEAFQRGLERGQQATERQQKMELAEFGEARERQRFPTAMEYTRALTDQARATSEASRAQTAREDKKLADTIENLRAQTASLRAQAANATSAEERARIEQRIRYAEAARAQAEIEQNLRARGLPPSAGSVAYPTPYYQPGMPQPAPAATMPGLMAPGGISAPLPAQLPMQPQQQSFSTPLGVPGAALASAPVIGSTPITSFAPPSGPIPPAVAAGQDYVIPPIGQLPSPPEASPQALPEAPPLRLGLAPGAATSYEDIPAPQRTASLPVTPQMVALAQNWQNMTPEQRQTAYTNTINTVNNELINIVGQRQTPDAGVLERFRVAQEQARIMSNQPQFMRAMEEFTTPVGVPVQSTYSEIAEGVQAYTPATGALPRRAAAPAAPTPTPAAAAAPTPTPAAAAAPAAPAAPAPTPAAPAPTPAAPAPTPAAGLASPEARNTDLAAAIQARSAIISLQQQLANSNGALRNAIIRGDVSAQAQISAFQADAATQLRQQQGVFAAATLRRGDSTYAEQLIKELFPDTNIARTADGGFVLSQPRPDGGRTMSRFTADELASQINLALNPQLQAQIESARQQQAKLAQIAYEVDQQIRRDAAREGAILNREAAIERIKAVVRPNALEVKTSPANPDQIIIVDPANRQVGVMTMTRDKVGNVDIVVPVPVMARVP